MDKGNVWGRQAVRNKTVLEDEGWQIETIFSTRVKVGSARTVAETQAVMGMWASTPANLLPFGTAGSLLLSSVFYFSREKNKQTGFYVESPDFLYWQLIQWKKNSVDQMKYICGPDLVFRPSICILRLRIWWQSLESWQNWSHMAPYSSLWMKGDRNSSLVVNHIIFIWGDSFGCSSRVHFWKPEISSCPCSCFWLIALEIKLDWSKLTWTLKDQYEGLINSFFQSES